MYLLIRQIDYMEFRDALKNVSIDGICIVVVAYIVSIIINAVKWHILLPNTKFLLLVELSFRAQLYSTVLPGQIFGDASKITAWSDNNENLTNVTASVIFDKLTGFISQILIGIMGIYSSSKATDINNKWAFLLIVIISLSCIYLSTESHVSKFIRKTISFMKKISPRLEKNCLSFYDSLCIFSTQKSVLLKSVFLGGIYQLTGIFSMWYLSSRMGLRIGLMEYCWIMPLMSLILILPVSFAGIGLRDASMASMLSLFDISAGNSLVLSMSMLLAQIISASIGGIYLLKSNFQKKK